jgi:hypothetical protein
MLQDYYPSATWLKINRFRMWEQEKKGQQQKMGGWIKVGDMDATLEIKGHVMSLEHQLNWSNITKCRLQWHVNQTNMF